MITGLGIWKRTARNRIRRPHRAGKGLLLLLALLLSATTHALDPLPFANEAERERFQSLAAELRCLVCQNNSLADSPATLAGDLRRVVLEQMRLGKSDAEIKEYLTDRYGEFVLYRPPFDSRTWWLWFGPGVLVVLGLAAVVVIVRRRRNIQGKQPLAPLEDETW